MILVQRNIIQGQLKSLAKALPIGRFLFFSDDIKWSAEFLNLKKDRVVYVDSREYPDPQCMDLYLMSKCKNNIIANSTFSWWAAWLNSNPDKIVIAP